MTPSPTKSAGRLGMPPPRSNVLHAACSRIPLGSTSAALVIALVLLLWPATQAAPAAPDDPPPCDSQEASETSALNAVAFRILQRYSPQPSEPGVSPENPRVFINQCYIVELKRTVVKATLAGSPSGSEKLDVDDRLVLRIEKQGWVVFFDRTFSRAAPTPIVNPEEPAILTSSLNFMTAGTYKIWVQAIDVIAGSRSASPVFLVLELEPVPTPAPTPTPTPPDGSRGLEQFAKLLAAIFVVLTLVGLGVWAYVTVRGQRIE